MSKGVKTILGTMTFGAEKTTEEESKAILEAFHTFEFAGEEKGAQKEIDTAIMYNDSYTEQILGNLGVFNRFTIASKANPNFKNGKCVAKDTSGLSAMKIRQQITKTLENLKADYVDIYYLHWPSHKVNILESLKTINELYKEGKIKEFGLSNYSAEQTREIHSLCVSNHFVLPTVYQGLYNVLSRRCEELFPTLRELNIRFYAFNPLAGGMLTDRYHKNDNPDEGRFSHSTTMGKRYRARYFHDELFDAVESVRSLAEKYQIPILEIAIRWLYYHSLLNRSEGDAVIIGASSVAQLNENMNAVNRGPLPDDLLPLLDHSYSLCASVAPPYYR